MVAEQNVTEIFKHEKKAWSRQSEVDKGENAGDTITLI